MLDPQLQQHPFKRVRVFGARGRELRPIVCQDLGKLEVVALVEQIEALQGAEHHRQTLQIGHHLRPGQAGTGVDHAHQIVAGGIGRNEILAQVMAVQMPQFPGFLLHNAAFLLS